MILKTASSRLGHLCRRSVCSRTLITADLVGQTMGNVACCDHSRPCCVLVIPNEASVESSSIAAPGTRRAIRTSPRPPADSLHTPEANNSSPDQNDPQMENPAVTGPTPQVVSEWNPRPTEGTALQQWVNGAGVPVSKGTCVLCGKLVLLKHAKFRWEDG